MHKDQEPGYAQPADVRAPHLHGGLLTLTPEIEVVPDVWGSGKGSRLWPIGTIVVTVAVVLLMSAWWAVAASGSSWQFGLSAGSPPPAADATSNRVLPPVQTGGDSNSYKFAVEVDGEPVTYSPCRNLSVVVNTAGAPAGAYGDVVDAVAEVSAASGLSITVAGRTDETFATDRPSYQPDRYGEKWAPILVSWSTADQVPALEGSILAIGGSEYWERDDGASSYVTGDITLDRDDFAKPWMSSQHTATLVHEFGHVLGLDHVDDVDQVMHASTAGDQVTLGDGDRAGLAALGRGACTPDL